VIQFLANLNLTFNPNSNPNSNPNPNPNPNPKDLTEFSVALLTHAPALWLSLPSDLACKTLALGLGLELGLELGLPIGISSLLYLLILT
jgi:hypothetical protein